jgi:polar amino acid transport system substrate-binding protein
LTVRRADNKVVYNLKNDIPQHGSTEHQVFPSFKEEVVLLVELNRRGFLSLGGAALGTAAVTGLVGCAPAGPSGTGSDAKFELVRTMQERGHAILGVIDSPPSSMVRDGQPAGYYADIAKAILKKYDITKFEAFQSDFPGLVPGLQAKRMDICCAGLLLTDERCDTLSMSAAAYVLIYSFAVPPGNPNNFASIADFVGTDKVLAIESATTQERVAREILPEDRILPVSGRQDGADAVRIGRADAYLAPQEAIAQVLESGGDPLDITDPVTDMPKIGSCFVLRKGDADFSAAFAEDFEELRASGEYAEIMEKYGADPTLIEMDGVQLSC